MTEDERRFLLRALSVSEGQACGDAARSSAAAQLRPLLASPRLQCVRRLLGRSLYYGLREQLHESEGKEVLQTVKATWRLLGLGGAVDAIVSGVPERLRVPVRGKEL